MDKDVEMLEKEIVSSDESDNSEEDSSNDDESVECEKISQLQNQVQANPYVYDSHIELITLLRKAGNLEELRDARQNMAKIFPLTEELWLAWLQDEIKLVNSDDERKRVNELFEQAVNDYLSLGVWLEYVQFSIGMISHEDGLAKIRAIFDRAIMVGGLHVTRGSGLWDAYREFELAILSGLQPAPGSVSTPQQLTDVDAQTKKITHLYKRQLSVPLIDMQTTWEEYKDWSPDGIDPNVEQIYKKAVEKMTMLLPHEQKLESSAAPHKEEYLSYIEIEHKQSDPARVQCLYERMIEENCLDTEMWVKYTEYMDTELKVGSVVLKVYRRAVRNCSWSDTLWIGYIRAMERYGQEHEKICETFQSAIDIGYSEGSQYVKLWQTYIDYLRRRINWDADYEAPLLELKDALDKACAIVKKMKGDDDDSILQYYARLEAMYLANMTTAREIWTEILQHGNGNKANSWMEYLRLERSYGDVKHCRKILQRAVNSVTDFPEIVVNAYINFERDEGTLESYDAAVKRCQSQLSRIEERKAAVAEREANKFQGRGKFNQDRSKPTFHKQQKQPFSHSEDNYQKPQQISHSQAKTFKRKLDPPANGSNSDQPMDDSDAFKKPDLPSPGKSSKKTAPPPGFVAAAPQKSAPPPGCVASAEPSPKPKKSGPPPGFVSETKEPPTKKRGPPPGFQKAQSKSEDVEMMDRLLAEEAKAEQSEDMPSSISYDISKYPRTVFVSNLSYDTTEEQIREAFIKIGQITDVRMVNNYDGKFKGFGYVEFIDELAATRALDLDRHRISGRPMFVSCCKDNKSEPAKFKFSTELEKSKLFVRNLPPVTDENALKTIFSQHGELVDVRLVTYKNGASKGMAYIHFRNESDAAKALQKTDGMEIGDKVISVAISNPPVRGQPQPKPQADRGGDRFAQQRAKSLGGGSRQPGGRKSTTHLSLMPRSLQKKPDPETAKPSGTTKTVSETTTDVKKPASKMSNDDFRAMLLKK